MPGDDEDLMRLMKRASGLRDAVRTQLAIMNEAMVAARQIHQRYARGRHDGMEEGWGEEWSALDPPALLAAPRAIAHPTQPRGPAGALAGPLIQIGVRVMCVDDNELVGEGIGRWVSRQPDFVWAGWVKDSDDPERRIREERPDVVLLDVDMAPRDGFELLDRFKASCPPVQVLMFSGLLRPEYVDRAFDGGATGYVWKDDPLDEIARAVREAAAGRWAMSRAVAGMAARSC